MLILMDHSAIYSIGVVKNYHSDGSLTNPGGVKEYHYDGSLTNQEGETDYHFDGSLTNPGESKTIILMDH